MCFHVVRGMTIVHTTLCPLTLSTMSLSWLPSGTIVSYNQSNGDTVLTTIISASKCGRYVSIECDTEGHYVSHPMALAHRIEDHVCSPSPSPDGVPKKSQDPNVEEDLVDDM